MTKISGSILLNGQNAANQLVLVLSADMNQFLDSAATDADGRYEIDLPASASTSPLVLVAKIQGPVLALDYRLVASESFGLPQDFIFYSSSVFFNTLRAELFADQDEKPPSLEIAITPVHLDGIPPAIEKFFLRRDKGVVDASFYEKKISENSFEVIVQRGSYRISGSRIIYKRPVVSSPASNNFIVDRIFEDSENAQLPGEPFGGFTLDLNRDRKINMHTQILSVKQSYP